MDGTIDKKAVSKAIKELTPVSKRLCEAIDRFLATVDELTPGRRTIATLVKSRDWKSTDNERFRGLTAR